MDMDKAPDSGVREEHTMDPTEQHTDAPVGANDLNDLSEDLDFSDLRAEDLDHDFEDLSHQIERVYQFDNYVLTITQPIALDKQPDGSHKVLAADGVSYDIYPKWNYIAWKSDDGEPHFTGDN